MTTQTPEPGSSRVEREIREILERADAPPAPIHQLQAAVRQQRAAAGTRLGRSAQPIWSTDLARMGGALALAAAAAATADVARLIAILLAFASAVLFFSLWVPARGPQTGGPQRWRGQDLSGSRPSPSIDLDRLWPWRNTKRRTD